MVSFAKIRLLRIKIIKNPRKKVGVFPPLLICGDGVLASWNLRGPRAHEPDVSSYFYTVRDMIVSTRRAVQNCLRSGSWRLPCATPGTGFVFLSRCDTAQAGDMIQVLWNFCRGLADDDVKS